MSGRAFFAPPSTLHGVVFAILRLAASGRSLARAEPHAGTQELLRIDRIAVDPGFIMQMRAGGAAGRTDRADHLSDLDDIADLDVDFRQMAVAGREPVAVVDLDHPAVAAGPA